MVDIDGEDSLEGSENDEGESEKDNGEMVESFDGEDKEDDDEGL